MNEYYIYLRKSRKDQEAEAHGEGETLARHEKALLDLAKKQHLNVTKIYREVVSGETIASRPEIQKMLLEVEQGIPAGVLVMEVERLARGDTKDQGIIAEAFKFGDVKIITPMKTYDPCNEFDEEYFEFGLFMSRREYKAINRRLQRGRMAAVQEGKYVAGAAPYGYRKIKIPHAKGYTLEIVEEQANVVRLIYDLYTTGELQDDNTYKKLGIYLICKKLDSMHIHPAINNSWSTATVKDILTNPTYTGKIRWQWRRYIKAIEGGEVTVKRPKDKNCMVCDGLHEAIIPEDQFNIAQEILSARSYPPVASNKVLKNPLTGIVKCAKCGKPMTRIKNKGKYNYYSLMCPNRNCSTVSAPIYLVEEKLIESLKEWIESYKLEWDADSHFDDSLLLVKKQAIVREEKNIDELKKQLSNTYTLVEKGIYSTDIFLERSKQLTDEINMTTNKLDTLRSKYQKELQREEARTSYIPKVEQIVETYSELESPEARNQLLKSVLEYVTYEKDTPNRKGNRDNANFKLCLYPNLPKTTD